MKKFFRGIWFCVRWGLLIGVVLAAIAVVYVLQQINSLAKEHVLAEIRGRFPDLDVYVGSVELSESKGVSIRKVELSLPASGTAPKQLVFAAEEIFVECPVTLQAFFAENIEITHITLKNPILRLTRLEDGSFEEPQYYRVKDWSQFCPVEIQNGTLFYDNLGDQIAEPTKITSLDIVATPSQEPGAQTPTLWTVIGKGKSDFIRLFSVE